jgi:hypothetical protein
MYDVPQLERASTGHGLILMYHRVANLDSDPWGLSVSPQHFDEQLAILNRLTQPTRLKELSSALSSGDSTKPPVAITFDVDTDNFQLPRLQVNDCDGDDFARWLTSLFGEREA